MIKSDLMIPILYEDNSCAVINKPAGILSHGLNTNDESPSIAKWWKNKPNIVKNGWITGREGIVHRLDFDTSGVMVLAKTPEALVKLQKQFHDRKIYKNYLAAVCGQPQQKSGKITSKITRAGKNRTKRASHLISFTDNKAREAVSLYRVIKSLKVDGNDISLIEFNIKTGRTHQVRLHAKMLGTPILGDRDYSTKPCRKLSEKLKVTRQMLHAKELKFRSPSHNKLVDINVLLPDDMKRIINE